MFGGYTDIADHEQHDHGSNHTILNSTEKETQPGADASGTHFKHLTISKLKRILRNRNSSSEPFHKIIDNYRGIKEKIP